MKIVNFYGMKSRDKTMLMLYLAKVFSVEYQVVVYTSNTYLQEEKTAFHYNDQMLITDNIDSALEEMTEYDFVFNDIYEKDVNHICQEEEQINVFVMGSWKEEVQFNEVYMSLIKSNDVLIYNGLLYDSGIDEKYLNLRFKVNNKDNQILKMYVNENDLVTHLDNEYGLRLSLRSLSRAYKKNLVKLMTYIDSTDEKDNKKLFKQAVRRG